MSCRNKNKYREMELFQINIPMNMTFPYFANLKNTIDFSYLLYLFSVNIYGIKAKKVTDLFRTGANPKIFFTH